MKKILMTVLALFCTLTTGCKTASTDNTSIDNVKYYTFSYNAICRIPFIVSSYKLHRRIQVYYWYKKRVTINILNF